jgi:hypothetical protein
MAPFYPPGNSIGFANARVLSLGVDAGFDNAAAFVLPTQADFSRLTVTADCSRELDRQRPIGAWAPKNWRY